MKKLFLLFLLPISLLGCSSSNNNHNVTISTGGETQGDTIIYYWYSHDGSEPLTASDYVTTGHHDWYQTTYRWNKDILVEVAREGEMTSEGEVIPYTINVRYNGKSEAVYQRYRKDGRVFPLKSKELTQFQEQSKHLVAKVKELNNKDIKLYQGIWDGDIFTTCDGVEYTQLEFGKVIPTSVVERLSDLENFLAFLGEFDDKLEMSTLLLLTDSDDEECIEMPELI